MKRTTFSSRHAALGAVLIGVCAALVGIGALTQDEDGALDALRAEIIPPAGTQTSYGIYLDLRDTAQFIEWFYDIELTDTERTVMEDALSELVAPCCDDNSAATCCCECNLARSVWGLAAYLIREKGFTVEDVREAAHDWLRFARPDYYLAAALVEEGSSPQEYGLTTNGSCYRGLCEFPVTEGGCAGMTALVEPDPATLPEVIAPEDNECLDDEESAAPNVSYGRIAPKDAAALVTAHRDDPRFVVLDVRTPEEFESGYIQRALNLNYYDPGFSDALQTLDKSATYLVYCRAGTRSAAAVRLIQELGFCCLYELDGGVLAWVADGLELEGV
jgi:phage shock protein E